jgi:putative oxidoreductase
MGRETTPWCRSVLARGSPLSPLLIDISVVILSTKVPILLRPGFWGFQLPKLDSYGWWSMLHEARTDMSMWFALVFLLAVGAAKFSVDARLTAPR